MNQGTLAIGAAGSRALVTKATDNTDDRRYEKKPHARTRHE
jgi:hypothetical protein